MPDEEDFTWEYGSRRKDGDNPVMTTYRLGTEIVDEQGKYSFRMGLVMRPEIYGEVLMRRKVSKWEDMTDDQIEESIEQKISTRSSGPYVPGDGHP